LTLSGPAGLLLAGWRAGVLVIAAPYLLGSLADHLGLRTAFAIEPALIGLCALLLVAGLQRTSK
jgi:hypothetical protein